MNYFCKTAFTTCLLLSLFSLSVRADIFNEEATSPVVNINKANETKQNAHRTIFDDEPVSNQDSGKQGKIEQVAIGNVLDKVSSSTGLVVLHVTSNDSACRYCIDSNSQYEAMVQQHPNAATYWRTDANPYRDVLKYPIAKSYDIKNLPVTILIENGKLVKKWEGATDASNLYSWIFRGTKFDRKSDVSILVSDELYVPIPQASMASKGVERVSDALINQRIKQIVDSTKPPETELAGLSREKKSQVIRSRYPVIVVSVSSYDAGCPPCIYHNQEYDDLAKRYAGRVYFLRLIRNPWYVRSSFATEYLVDTMPMTMLFNGPTLVNQVRSVLNSADLEKLLFYKLPAKDASWYQASGEKVSMPDAQSQDKSPIRFVPVSQDSSVLINAIQHSRGLLVVNIFNEITPTRVPSYLKILHNKYAGKVNFFHTLDDLGRVYREQLGRLYGLAGTPNVLLFKDGKLVRKYSLNEKPNQLTLGGGEDREKQEMYAVQIEHALFD